MQKFCVDYEIYIASFLWRPLSCTHEKYSCKINLIQVLTDIWSQKHSQYRKIENILEKHHVTKSLFQFLWFHTKAKCYRDHKDQYLKVCVTFSMEANFKQGVEAGKMENRIDFFFFNRKGKIPLPGRPIIKLVPNRNRQWINYLNNLTDRTFKSSSWHDI